MCSLVQQLLVVLEAERAAGWPQEEEDDERSDEIEEDLGCPVGYC